MGTTKRFGVRHHHQLEDFTSPLLWTGTVSNWHLIFKLAVYPAHAFARESSSFALTWGIGQVRTRAHCCELLACCRKFMLQNQKAAYSLHEVHASQQANIKAFACDLLVSFLSMVSELGYQRFFSFLSMVSELGYQRFFLIYINKHGERRSLYSIRLEFFSTAPCYSLTNFHTSHSDKLWQAYFFSSIEIICFKENVKVERLRPFFSQNNPFQKKTLL